VNLNPWSLHGKSLEVLIVHLEMTIHTFMYLLPKKWKDISNTFVSVLLD